jgi:hypothetical protein
VLLWEGDGSFSFSLDASVSHAQGSSEEQSHGLNRKTFQVSSPSNNGIFFRISSVATDYLRNLRLLMPGGVCGVDSTHLDPFRYCQTARGGTGTCDPGETCFDFEQVYWDRFRDPVSEMSHPKVVFHPKFLETHRKYRGVRALSWMAVHGNVLESWTDRAGLGKQTYGDYGGGSSTKKDRGVPYEVLIALGNALHADLWINIPVRTTNDFC